MCKFSSIFANSVENVTFAKTRKSDFFRFFGVLRKSEKMSFFWCWVPPNVGARARPRWTGGCEAFFSYNVIKKIGRKGEKSRYT